MKTTPLLTCIAALAAPALAQKPTNPRASNLPKAPPTNTPVASKPAVPKPAASTPLTPATAQTSNPYSQTPFDIHLMTIPSNFKGNDIVDIYQKLKTPLAPKGKLETVEAYKARLANGWKKPINNQLTPQSLFSLVIPLDTDRDFPDTEYDAESQTLSIRRVTGKVAAPLDEEEIFAKQRVIFTDRFKSTLLRTYEVTPTGNKKIKITVKKSDEYQLLASNLKDFDLIKGEERASDEEQDLNYDVSMDAEKAEKLNWNLDMLVLFNLTKPYVAEGEEISEPSMESPVHFTRYAYYLCVNIKEIWLFNSKTGEIVHKLKPRV